MTIGQIILCVVLALVALVLFVFIYFGIKNRIIRKRQKRIFLETFGNKNFALPSIVYSYTYWWPTYKITFDNATAYQNAQQQDLLTQFENAIGDIYGKEFDPKRAISYLYHDNDTVKSADT